MLVGAGLGAVLLVSMGTGIPGMAIEIGGALTILGLTSSRHSACV